jgi:hypothetical protein
MEGKDYLYNAKIYGMRYLLHGILEKTGILKIKKTDFDIQRYFLSLPQEKWEGELIRWFQINTGEVLDLDKPRTFNEKQQWLKLYDSTPIKTELTDKYLVRAWIKKMIGEEYLIPMLGVWTCFDDIDFNKLPEKFVLKCVHGSGMNIIVRDKDELNRKEAKKKIDFWMKTSYGIGPMQEWHYRDIPHRVIAEEYMENIEGDLYDYKVYCFNGQPAFIQVITGRAEGGHTAFYTLDWEEAGFTATIFTPLTRKPEQPKQLKRMIELAKKLSKEFCFVRVDFYLMGDNKIYFGEMTFTPASGAIVWIPNGTNERLGDMIRLPQSKHQLKETAKDASKICDGGV